ncbi:Cys-Gln thioester bond-forming surface protein [Ruficoccus amylovorans]|uniref:Cys-Gln thioester bond-forming surface protein n=1 Tax=Ruficoccus amylovorans TaxID=1804625 RepID=A0A842HG04_9BACT|nr:Cys-Gln thioester bond-forming surface protein [Ruficoccus amylovorans]MBC2594507.1 Cys-Gln thioester bond-forming surface protein [Ruficoccus amylovorans]
MKFNLLKTTFGQAGVAAAAIFGLTAVASATPVSFTFDSFTKSSTINTNMGKLYVGTINLTFLDESSTMTPMQTVAFCAEIEQVISVGSTYTNYQTYSLTDPAGLALSEAQARNIAILYDKYYPTNQDLSSWSQEDAGAFQLALWELIYDDDGIWVNNGLSDGNFQVSVDDQPATNGPQRERNTVNQAKNYLNYVNSEAQNGNNYPYPDLVSIVSPTNQDLIVLGIAIPEGGGGSPVAVPFGVNPLPGLALIGFFGWRRLRKRINARSESEQA